MKIDIIKELISEFETSNVYKMKIEVDDLKLELEKTPVNVAPIINAPVVNQETVNLQTKEVCNDEISGTPVKSPLVGVFYAASSPTAKPYVEVGKAVKKGQVLCIVEAMKVMNEIKAPIDGVVTAIMKKSEELVEFDQVLMIIEG